MITIKKVFINPYIQIIQQKECMLVIIERIQQVYFKSENNYVNKIINLMLIEIKIIKYYQEQLLEKTTKSTSAQ